MARGRTNDVRPAKQTALYLTTFHLLQVGHNTKRCLFCRDKVRRLSTPRENYQQPLCPNQSRFENLDISCGDKNTNALQFLKISPNFLDF